MKDLKIITSNSNIPRPENFKKELQSRLQKQKAFFNRKEVGDILLYINYLNRGIPHLPAYFYNLLANSDIRNLCNDNIIEDIVLNYVGQVRLSYFGFYSIKDDALPAFSDVYFNMGAITSAMSGKEVKFYGQTTVCTPNLSWKHIKNLKFDKNNPWIRFSHSVNKALWKIWDEDYLMGGYWHSSPLDAAWSIRGSDIFEEMYTNPVNVKKLIEFCVNWSIELEKTINEDIEVVQGYRGILATLVPDGAIFVNGDPIDLINEEMGKIFDIPYSSRLFSKLGGGFYHHHSKGLHQVSQVAQIKNLYLQNFVNDYPSTPDLAETIISNKKIRENIIKASFIAPVMIDSAHYSQLQKLIPMLKEGRFIINFICDSFKDACDCINKVERINKLKS